MFKLLTSPIIPPAIFNPRRVPHAKYRCDASSLPTGLLRAVRLLECEEVDEKRERGGDVQREVGAKRDADQGGAVHGAGRFVRRVSLHDERGGERHEGPVDGGDYNGELERRLVTVELDQ